jgi:hypothetical protein
MKMTKPTNHLQWSRSSRCASNGCVEVAQDGDLVLLRDSKSPGTAPLQFTQKEWSAFLAGARDGEFDFA